MGVFSEMGLFSELTSIVHNLCYERPISILKVAFSNSQDNLSNGVLRFKFYD